MLIDQLPEIVKQAALGLHGANVNILNGAEGLSEIAAGLVSQGLAILESVKKATNSPLSETAPQPSTTTTRNATAVTVGHQPG